MNWRETLRTGLEAIRAHRLRSGLTMLGILIGIAAVILTVGLGEGASAQIRAQINSLGTNLLIITPGSATSAGGVNGPQGSATTLSVQDAGALASKVTAPDIAVVAPTSQAPQTLIAGTANWTTNMVGTTPGWLEARARTIAEGRFLTAADEKNVAAVTVLGPTTAKKLFGTSDPLGQTVNINGVPLQVVGVLTSAGSTSSATDEDDQALVPLPTMEQEIGGNSRTSVDTIYVEATSQATLSAADQEATTLLLNLHGVSAANPDFTINSQQSLLSTATSVNQTLTVLLAGIAAISLLVGGIGVMNIMLVSVIERIREIGLRKALGATPRVIRRQFLLEASLLGLTGGVLGAATGLAGAVILPHLISDTITISPAAIVGSIAVAVVIGLVFGVYPASRAARLAPIDALRNE
ncbi:MAG: putative transport system permease protein [Streptosporangiaceae bacterium]|nr:putative transport system permease protein [Streptosporangiaceae bacterium]